MKKLFALLVVFVLSFALCSCGGPNLEECTKSADEIVSNYTSASGAAYKYQSAFVSKSDVVENPTYHIFMMIDVEKLEGMANEVNNQFRDTILNSSIEHLDNNIDCIKEDLNALKSLVTPVFEGTDVVVETSYYNIDGNATVY